MLHFTQTGQMSRAIDLCGDWTVLYLDCRGNFRNLYIDWHIKWHKTIHVHSTNVNFLLINLYSYLILYLTAHDLIIGENRVNGTWDIAVLVLEGKTKKKALRLRHQAPSPRKSTVFLLAAHFQGKIEYLKF